MEMVRWSCLGWNRKRLSRQAQGLPYSWLSWRGSLTIFHDEITADKHINLLHFYQPMLQSEMIKTEFHCHTCYGKDSLIKIQDLVIACENMGIQKLVVTDHN